MLEALVLAGGASTRMGSPKAALLTSDGRPFIVRILDTLASAGLTRLTVVTGVHHDAVLAACTPRRTGWSDARFVRNPEPALGQLSSLLIGMRAVVDERTEGLLVTLVDVPMVSVSTVERVVREWERTRAPIVRPAIGDAHGHPVIFDRQVFQTLRESPLDVGAKAVIRAYADRIANVAVDDVGCLLDIDTPGDYARIGAGA